MEHEQHFLRISASQWHHDMSISTCVLLFKTMIVAKLLCDYQQHSNKTYLPKSMFEQVSFSRTWCNQFHQQVQENFLITHHRWSDLKNLSSTSILLTKMKKKSS